jgi:phytoene dehydrogenase-like protein
MVGARLGGLTTAAYLATNGLHTLHLDQGKVAGGCSQALHRRGRYQFDVGDCQPHGTMWGLLRHETTEG